MCGAGGHLRTDRSVSVAVLMLFASSFALGCEGGSSQASSGSGGRATPTANSLSPATVEAGSTGFTLTVSGSGFDSSCAIEWNLGNYQLSTLPTTFVSAAELQAPVSASLVSDIGFASVSVNCASGLLKFIISGFPRTEIDEPANDLVWDAKNQVIYLSVAPTVPGGDAIAILNPFSAKIVSTEAVGNNPDVLAISDDSQFLYVGLDDTSSIQRFTLPLLSQDINIPVGPSPDFAWNIQVAPGMPHTTAVSVGNADDMGNPVDGTMIYDDGTPRPDKLQGGMYGYYFSSLQWNSGATALYADNSVSTSFDFYILAVDSSGLTLTQDYPNVFSSFGGLYGNYIHYLPATNLIYSDDRHVVNPASGASIAMFNSPTTEANINKMVPDPKLNIAFFLFESNCIFDGVGTCYTIESYDLTNYKFISSLTMSEIQGQAVNMIRWGNSGLAFNTDTGQVYLVDITSILQAQLAQPAYQRKAERVPFPLEDRRIMITSPRLLRRGSLP